MDARCGAEARVLRWTLNGDHVDVERVVKETGADNAAVDVQLRAGDIEDAQVTLMATRPAPDGSTPRDLFLNVGDTVEVSSRRIGSMRNRIVSR